MKDEASENEDSVLRELLQADSQHLAGILNSEVQPEQIAEVAVEAKESQSIRLSEISDIFSDLPDDSFQEEIKEKLADVQELEGKSNQSKKDFNQTKQDPPEEKAVADGEISDAIKSCKSNNSEKVALHYVACKAGMNENDKARI